jgi:hypothetical protein
MFKDVEWKIREYIVGSSIKMQEIKIKQSPQDRFDKAEQ